MTFINNFCSVECISYLFLLYIKKAISGNASNIMPAVDLKGLQGILS